MPSRHRHDAVERDHVLLRQVLDRDLEQRQPVLVDLGVPQDEGRTPSAVDGGGEHRQPRPVDPQRAPAARQGQARELDGDRVGEFPDLLGSLVLLLVRKGEREHRLVVGAGVERVDEGDPRQQAGVRVPARLLLREERVPSSVPGLERDPGGEQRRRAEPRPCPGSEGVVGLAEQACGPVVERPQPDVGPDGVVRRVVDVHGPPTARVEGHVHGELVRVLRDDPALADGGARLRLAFVPRQHTGERQHRHQQPSRAEETRGRPREWCDLGRRG